MSYIFTIIPKDDLKGIDYEEFEEELDKSIGLIVDLLKAYEQDVCVELEGTNKIKISLSEVSSLESLPLTLNECKDIFRNGAVFDGLLVPKDKLVTKIIPIAE